MERTKKVTKSSEEEIPVEPVIRWKKLGGGSFRMRNRVIKPNQIFSAPASEIPMGFRDVIVPVDELPEPVTRMVTPKISEYKIVKRDKGNWFDVFSGDKQINEKALTKEAAEKLIETLS